MMPSVKVLDEMLAMLTADYDALAFKPDGTQRLTMTREEEEQHYELDTAIEVLERLLRGR